MKTILRFLCNMYNDFLGITFRIVHRILPNNRLQAKIERKIIKLQLHFLERVIVLKQIKAI